MGTILIDAITGSQDFRLITAYLTGPVVGGVNQNTYKFCTKESVRNNLLYDGVLLDSPVPIDSMGDAYGIQQGGSFSAQIVMSAFFPVASLYALALIAQGMQFDLELVSQIKKIDGTVIEMTDVRRAVAKKIKIAKGVLSIDFADVNLDALSKTYPFKTYTVADFSRLYVDHVGRPVVDLGPGTHIKIPLTFIADNSGPGPYKFALCESRSGMTYTINTIYRDGQIVNPAEYTTGTTTGSTTGVVVQHVQFVKEQRDSRPALYVLQADVSVTGATREPSNEIARILALFGVTVTASNVTAAAAVDAAGSYLCDAAYTRAKTGVSIITDLLKMARSDLQRGTNGDWVLVQSKANSSVVTYSESADLISFNSYSQPEVPIEVRCNYRPAKSGEDTGFSMPAQVRATGGGGKAAIYDLPYCYDGNVADRLADYYSKRSKLWAGEFVVFGAQWAGGDQITITGNTCFSGNKSFVASNITRVPDGNQIIAREYDATIFTYTAGTIPANAGNTYAPDYAQTPPVAPTSLSIPSQGTNQATAFALVRAVPPASNWSSLVAQIKNSTTGEIYQATLQLVSGNYEAAISGLKTGNTHSLTVWAVNATGIAGAVASYGTFTSNGATQYIADTHILTGGVGTTSIATGGVLNGNVGPTTLTISRQNTADYYYSTSVAAGANIDLGYLTGTYTPRITADFPADFTLRPASDVGGMGTGNIGVYNNAAVARTLYRYYKVLQ